MIKGREYSVTPPLHALLGDSLERGTGNSIHLRRGGAIVATSTLGPAIKVDSGNVTTKRIISSIFEAEEITMSNTMTISDVIHNADGTKEIKFPNGSGLVMSVEDLDALGDTVYEDNWKLAFMVARWKLASSTYATDETISGKTIEVHPDSNLTPVAVGVI